MDWEARRKAMMSEFRIHTVIIGVPLFAAAFISKSILHMANFKIEYFGLLYLAICVIDYVLLKLRYRV